MLGAALAILACSFPAPSTVSGSGDVVERAGEAGGSGLALRCGKALTVADEHPVVDGALILIRDGRIEAIGSQGELEVPAGFAELDVGESWIMPGMIDLHSHIAGSFDINGAVYQANPGLRVSASVVPANRLLQRAVAAGVTTILYIPGSATTMGGQGVLLKTGPEVFEDMRIREPGSLKLAQADNPKRWGWGMGRLSLNWQIRNTFRRGVAYARRWRAFEEEGGAEPALQPEWEVFRHLLDGRAQVSAHTQVHQVVSQSIRIVCEEFDLPLYIDHGSFDGYLSAAYADEQGVPAILGPRSISLQNKGRGIDHDGRFVGMAAEYQARGHRHIGFNTDAPVIPQEELALQAGMGVRYGFDDGAMGTIRGLTLEPARAAGIDELVGSLETGKDADFVVVAGHPSDPRNAVELVFIEGRLVYDASEGRLF